jgi:hypothetical protein
MPSSYGTIHFLEINGTLLNKRQTNVNDSKVEWLEVFLEFQLIGSIQEMIRDYGLRDILRCVRSSMPTGN